MNFRNKSDTGRRRFSPFLWVASLAAVAVLALGISGTLSQFVATITNNANQAETVGGNSFSFTEGLQGAPEGDQNPCATVNGSGSATCSTVNKYGEGGAVKTPMAPGSSRTTTVVFTNTSIPTGLSGTMRLTVAPCVQTPSVSLPSVGDLCGTLVTSVDCSLSTGPPAFEVGIPIPPGITLTAFQGTPAQTPYLVGVLPPAATATCTFTTQLPSSATAANLQNISVSQNLIWTFTQV